MAIKQNNNHATSKLGPNLHQPHKRSNKNIIQRQHNQVVIFQTACYENGDMQFENKYNNA